MDSLPPHVLEFFLDRPAARPPPGVEVNLTKPRTITIHGYIDISICFAFASSAYFMNLYTKLFIIRRFHLEDYVLFLSYCQFVAFIAVICVVVEHGLFHQWDLRVRDLYLYLWYFRIIDFQYSALLATVKTAILVQYLRIFVPVKKSGAFFWSCHALIWLHIIFYASSIFLQAFQCSPIKKAYDPLLLISNEGSCTSFSKHKVGSAAVNVFGDFAILLLPQFVIWNLSMSRTKKIGVSAMFAIGILGCISSIMRLYASIVLFQHVDVDVAGVDMVGKSIKIGFWIIPEIACGILVAAMPVTPKFFQTLRDSSSFTSLHGFVSSTFATLIRVEKDGQTQTSGLQMSQRNSRHFGTGREDTTQTQNITSLQSASKDRVRNIQTYEIVRMDFSPSRKASSVESIEVGVFHGV